MKLTDSQALESSALYARISTPARPTWIVFVTVPVMSPASAACAGGVAAPSVSSPASTHRQSASKVEGAECAFVARRAWTATAIPCPKVVVSQQTEGYIQRTSGARVAGRPRGAGVPAHWLAQLGLAPRVLRGHLRFRRVRGRPKRHSLTVVDDQGQAWLLP